MNPLPFVSRRGACLAAALIVLPVLRADESLESVEQAALGWAKLRTETVRLDTEWRSRRELLAATETALLERCRYLETKRAEAAAQGAKQRQLQAELAATGAGAAQSLAQVKERLDTLSRELVRLQPSLPPRLADALALPLKTLADPATAPGERVQLILRVLNRCTQFNKTVTAVDEVVTPQGETAARQLEVLYWGLSHGYALDRAHHRAYLGHPGATGWIWEPLGGGDDAVVRLLAIAKDQAEPTLVEAPARLFTYPGKPQL